MSKVGIIAYGTSPFTKEDHKIEPILHKSTNNLFKKNPKINKNEIDVRPIVSGNFLKNEVIKFYNYEIHSDLNNSEYLDEFGFFIGNHHYDISKKIDFLYETLNSL